MTLSGVLRLSLIVPTYQAPERLRALLGSIRTQTIDASSAEVIIVDDGTPGFDRCAWEGMAGDFALTILHLPSNRGRAAARNAGIRVARGEIVIFLDGDMTVEAGFLAAHDSFHGRHPGAVAVGGILWAPEVPDTPLARYSVRRGVVRFGAGPVPFQCFVTGNSSAPRQSLVDVGGFDESFSTYGGEDLELGYRLHLAGLDVYYEPTAVALHFGGKDMGAMREAMAVYGSGSLPLLLARHPELAKLLRLDFLQQPWWWPRRWGLKVALWSAVQATVFRIAQWGEGWGYVPDLFFDYLWWCERTRAYLLSLRRSG